MASLNGATRLLDRGKVYISVASMIIIITILYLLDAGMTPSIHKHSRCRIALSYNITMNDTTQP